jgi:hypothetical protein
VKTDYWKTIDGVTIVDGLRVWDYNLDIAVVDVKGTREADPSYKYHQHWDGWFEMKDPEGHRSSTMNGERMWVRHPTTGERA